MQRKDVSRMRKIKHIHLMTANEILDVFSGIKSIKNIKELDKILEFSEKIDFINCSVTIDKDGKIGVKSKSSDLLVNPEEIDKIIEESGITLFEDFKNFLEYLRKRKAEKWFIEIRNKYLNNILKLLNNNKNRLSKTIKDLMGKREIEDKEIKKFKFNEDNIYKIQIFGELATPNTMNLIKYSLDKITPGAFVVFGCVVIVRNPENPEKNKFSNIDMSVTNIGKEIMLDFIKTFNSNDWHVYFKNIIPYIKASNISEIIKSIHELVNFVEKNKEYIDKKIDELKEEIASKRKETPETDSSDSSTDFNTDSNVIKIMFDVYSKDKVLNKYIKLIDVVKKEILKSAPEKSFLGSEEIEGVVIRNKKTDSIVKIVDLEKFTVRNIKKWEDVKYVQTATRELYKGIVENIFGNPDILHLSTKLKEKINDYLLSGNKLTTLDDVILNVVIPDIEDDIGKKLDSLFTKPAFDSKIKQLLENYLEKLKTIVIKLTSKQELEKLDKEVLYKINSIKAKINNLLSKLKSTKSIYSSVAEVIKFLYIDFGSKAFNTLLQNYKK